jgi:hypothetical protein
MIKTMIESLTEPATIASIITILLVVIMYEIALRKTEKRKAIIQDFYKERLNILTNQAVEYIEELYKSDMKSIAIQSVALERFEYSEFLEKVNKELSKPKYNKKLDSGDLSE